MKYIIYSLWHNHFQKYHKYKSHYHICWSLRDNKAIELTVRKSFVEFNLRKCVLSNYINNILPRHKGTINLSVKVSPRLVSFGAKNTEVIWQKNSRIKCNMEKGRTDEILSAKLAFSVQLRLVKESSLSQMEI